MSPTDFPFFCFLPCGRKIATKPRFNTANRRSARCSRAHEIRLGWMRMTESELESIRTPWQRNTKSREGHFPTVVPLLPDESKFSPFRYNERELAECQSMSYKRGFTVFLALHLQFWVRERYLIDTSPEEEDDDGKTLSTPISPSYYIYNHH